jgi:branched-chain amino acid transport system substrate-binding protein
VAALAQARPDAIFNGTFGPDLTNFVRQGNTRGLFEKRGVISVLTGEPEYLEPLGDETPEGWYVTGWPVESVSDPTSMAFINAYKARFGEMPKMGSVVGHATITAIVGGIAKTGSVETEAMADGFKGAKFPTPFGEAMWRPQDNQGTLGTYVGRTALKGGKGVMVDWRYADGAGALPSDEEVKRLRPG